MHGREEIRQKVEQLNKMAYHLAFLRVSTLTKHIADIQFHSTLSEYREFKAVYVFFLDYKLGRVEEFCCRHDDLVILPACLLPYSCAILPLHRRHAKTVLQIIRYCDRLRRAFISTGIVLVSSAEICALEIASPALG